LYAQSQGSSRFLSAFFCALILCGCTAKPQVIKEVVYIDKPCDRAKDAAPSVWLPIRWIAVTIDSVGYTATPDGEALLGNLLRLKESKNNADLNMSSTEQKPTSGTTHTHKLDAADIVLTSGDQTVAGVKTFSDAPVLPDKALATAKIADVATDTAADDTAFAATTLTYPTLLQRLWRGITGLRARTITAGAGLSGGGDLSTDRTIALGTPSEITGDSVNSASGTTHTHKLEFASFSTTQRTSSVTYTNNLSVPLFLLATNDYSASSGLHRYMHMYIDGTRIAQSAAATSAANTANFLSAIIPPGATYRIEAFANSSGGQRSINSIYTYPII
jgi:hypothetical protein